MTGSRARSARCMASQKRTRSRTRSGAKPGARQSSRRWRWHNCEHVTAGGAHWFGRLTYRPEQAIQHGRTRYRVCTYCGRPGTRGIRQWAARAAGTDDDARRQVAAARREQPCTRSIQSGLSTISTNCGSGNGTRVHPGRLARLRERIFQRVGAVSVRVWICEQRGNSSTD